MSRLHDLEPGTEFSDGLHGYVKLGWFRITKRRDGTPRREYGVQCACGLPPGVFDGSTEVFVTHDPRNRNVDNPNP